MFNKLKNCIYEEMLERHHNLIKKRQHKLIETKRPEASKAKLSTSFDSKPLINLIEFPNANSEGNGFTGVSDNVIFQNGNIIGVSAPGKSFVSVVNQNPIQKTIDIRVAYPDEINSEEFFEQIKMIAQKNGYEVKKINLENIN